MAQEKKKSKKWIVIVIFLIAAGVIMALLYANGTFDPQSPAERDRAALAGQLPGKSAEDIENILNTQVEKGMLNIAINSKPVFENANTEGNLNIENIPGNQYAMRVRITRDDTGIVVYESKLIDPGYYIEKSKLTSPLEKGRYDCTAVFTAVDAVTAEEVGTAAAKITITVLN